MYLVRKLWFVMLGLVLPLAAYAQENKGIVPCGPTSQKFDHECTIKDIFVLLVGIYNFLLSMAALVAFGFLIYGAIQMFLYSADENSIANGKQTIMQALIGLAITALAYILVNTLVSALGLTEGAGGFFSGTIFGN